MDKNRKIKYLEGRTQPWGVFVSDMGGAKILKATYRTKEEAENWVQEEEKKYVAPLGELANDDSECDEVIEASVESFPASDPPSWTRVSIRGTKKDKKAG